MNEDKATRYHRLRRRAELLGTASAGLVLLALALSGLSQRIRELAAAISQWAPDALNDIAMVSIVTVVVMVIMAPEG